MNWECRVGIIGTPGTALQRVAAEGKEKMLMPEYAELANCVIGHRCRVAMLDAATYNRPRCGEIRADIMRQ